VKSKTRKSVNQPWEKLNAPDILGNDAFRSRLQNQVREDTGGIPKRKTLLRHLPLTEIAGTGRPGSEWMREACRNHGYIMQAIADHADCTIPL